MIQVGLDLIKSQPSKIPQNCDQFRYPFHTQELKGRVEGTQAFIVDDLTIHCQIASVAEFQYLVIS